MPLPHEHPKLSYFCCRCIEESPYDEKKSILEWIFKLNNPKKSLFFSLDLFVNSFEIYVKSRTIGPSPIMRIHFLGRLPAQKISGRCKLWNVCSSQLHSSWSIAIFLADLKKNTSGKFSIKITKIPLTLIGQSFPSSTRNPFVINRKVLFSNCERGFCFPHKFKVCLMIGCGPRGDLWIICPLIWLKLEIDNWLLYREAG